MWDIKCLSLRHEPNDRLSVGTHDDVIKWKHFPRYWPFVRGIHRSGPRWIPRTKASDAELSCFRWSAPEWTLTITTITITIILLPYTIHEDNSSDVEKHNWPKSTFKEIVLKEIRVKIKTRIEVYVMIHRISNIANHKQHIFLHMAKGAEAVKLMGSIFITF